MELASGLAFGAAVLKFYRSMNRGYSAHVERIGRKYWRRGKFVNQGNIIPQYGRCKKYAIVSIWRLALPLFKVYFLSLSYFICSLSLSLFLSYSNSCQKNLSKKDMLSYSILCFIEWIWYIPKCYWRVHPVLRIRVRDWLDPDPILSKTPEPTLEKKKEPNLTLKKPRTDPN